MDRNANEIDILVLDPDVAGHHGSYVALVLRAFLGAGLTVAFVATDRLKKSGEIAALLGAYPGSLLVIDTSMPKVRFGRLIGATLAASFAWWFAMRRWTRQLARTNSVRRVFVPYLDYAQYACALVGSPVGKIPWSALLMGVHFHHSATDHGYEDRNGRWKRVVFRRLLALSHLHRLYVIDPFVQDALSEIEGRKISYLPDPAQYTYESQESAKAKLEVPSGSFVVLMYGNITARKGLESLLAAAVDPRLDSRVVIVVAGEPDAESADAISQARESLGPSAESRFVLMPGYVDPAMEAVLFSACDSVWLGYKGHQGMSGVLVLAGLYGKPVISTRRGLVGHLTLDRKLGLVLDENTTAVDAINRLARESAFAHSCGERGRAAFKAHTHEEFTKKLLRMEFEDCTTLVRTSNG